jgi:AraC-like DNA-binding protein
MSDTELPDTKHAVVAWANYYQFAPMERRRRPEVESRMFLWNKRGSGKVIVNGQEIAFSEGDSLFLPWKHDVTYEADKDDPFLVGGIHVIPVHRMGKPVKFSVAHRSTDLLAGSPQRSDARWPSLESLVRGSIKEGRLAHLAPYIVELFTSGRYDEPMMRELAKLLVYEIALATRENPRGAHSLPAPLRKIQQHIRTHLNARLTVHELAQAGDCSEATIHRLFKRFAGVTPHRFIVGERIREACRLLRITSHPIHSIGVMVGFEDQFHFSRFFKNELGMSPRSYREQLSLF